LLEDVMGDVTRILEAIEQGDTDAAEGLFPLVYEDLRELAAQKLAQESPGQTLQATALVHEVYLRLVDVAKARGWQSRRHFFAAAAEAMRHILVDRARKKHSEKRGGGRLRVEFNEASFAAPEAAEEILAVNEALDELAKVDPQAAQLVNLRYFAGFSIPEVAEALNIPPRSADRVWAYARAWLRRAIDGAET
jgi:RNA polymerase sigma factor (TIGR02999 family)